MRNKRVKAILLSIAMVFTAIFGCIPEADAANTVPNGRIISVEQDNFGVIVVTLEESYQMDGYLVYRSTSKNGTYELVGDVFAEDEYTDGNGFEYREYPEKYAKKYYYKARAFKWNDDYTKQNMAKKYTDVKGVDFKYNLIAEPASTSSIKLKFNLTQDVKYYSIYRSTDKKSNYTKLCTKYSNGKSYDTYTDKKLTFGKKYYYKLVKTDKLQVTTESPTTEAPTTEAPTTEATTEATTEVIPTDQPAADTALSAGNELLSGTKNAGKTYYFSDAETLATAAGMTGLASTKINSAKVISQRQMRIRWNKNSKAEGYKIYQLRNDGSYKLLKTLEGGSTTSCVIDGFKHGEVKRLSVVSFMNYQGMKVVSPYGDTYGCLMNYFACEKETLDMKVYRIFGKGGWVNKRYANATDASNHMTTITFKAWNFANGKSGKKVTTIRRVTVNKLIAPTMQRILDEIYHGKEKFPIKYCGGYRYYTGGAGQHAQGLAVDINPNENPEITRGRVTCGVKWEPGKNPYSIATNGEVANIFKKYGFKQGLWRTKQDYMHFSYFGR
ncbi:MAG: M15 family metallopeptidase [Lachnospiraceae bacterium]|nr:M15 family metallopeptidase [Lachnospiraceae bacterium]